MENSIPWVFFNDHSFKFQFQWADKNYRRLLRMSGAGGKEKDKVEKVGSDFHRKILGGSDTNENISLAQFSVLVLFHSVRGGSQLCPLHKFSSFFEVFFLFQVEMKDGYVTNYYSDTYPGLIVRLEFRRKLHYHLLQVSSCSIFCTFYRDSSCSMYG